ncbi:MAG: tRNA preQ1(34) S-adenosylmethionine ribosyltransferase-isomerase QueA [Planctomycetota bacterium]|nr:MAG: tRNA preQ1(34) S-adenosylmethionine ribosyltransferase-isomerase QueA [Planctomycetota bacterium]
MRTEDLDFPLPEELIALHPPARRRDSRLLEVRLPAGEVRHHGFPGLKDLLRDGDLLVLNDTKVIPARLLGRKSSGGKVEILWLEETAAGQGLALIQGGRLRPGIEVELAPGEGCLRLKEKGSQGRWLLENESDLSWLQLFAKFGHTPLPPYIRGRRPPGGQDLPEDQERYQSVWAQAAGAVAAPTASLHFDSAMLQALEQAGVERAMLTLHVGAGTFLPVQSERLEDHPMHEEVFEVSSSCLRQLAAARRRGSRIVAVGTTVCRVLEHLGRGPFSPDRQEPAVLASGLQGRTDLFLTPGSPFRWTDALLTNFHTPKSTLLALVAAFAEHSGAEPGLSLVKKVYAEAVRQRYRFYSYGDASFWHLAGRS